MVKLGSKKVTGTSASKNARKTLASGATGPKSKTAAASALSHKGAPEKKTGQEAASAASSVLRDGRTAKPSKSSAGSALSENPGSKKKARVKKFL